MFGLFRTLIANAVHGVTHLFEKRLEIQGVGYRASMEGKNLNLALGYSHPVIVEPPEGITISVEANTKISVKGANKQTVGDVAAFIRSKRPPEVYKGKGVRYEGEHIRRKAGKAGKNKIGVGYVEEPCVYLIPKLIRYLLKIVSCQKFLMIAFETLCPPLEGGPKSLISRWGMI